MTAIKGIAVDEWLLILAGILISTLHFNFFYYAYDAPKWFIFDLLLSFYLILNIKQLLQIKLSVVGVLFSLSILYCIASSFWAPNTGAAIELSYRFLFAVLSSYILCNKNNSQKIYTTSAITITCSALAFTSLFYFERYILELSTNVGSFSPFGFMNNSAQVFNMWIPILILSIFTYRKNFKVLAIAVPVLIALVSILMEASTRGCIIGLFIGEGIVFSIMLFQDRKKAILFLSTSLLLIIGIGSYQLIDALEEGRLSSKISAMENAISPSNARIKLYENSIDMLLDNPLGVGSNNFEFVHPKYAKPGTSDSSPYVNEHQILRTPHNILFKFYTEQGLLGGSLFLLSLLGLYILAIVNAIKGDFKDRWILVAITATLFHSMLSAVFLTPGSLFFSIFVFAYITKRSHELAYSKIILTLYGRPSLVVLPLLIVTTSTLTLTSKAYSFKGYRLASPEDLLISLQFNPYNERALFTLAHLEYRKNRDPAASFNAINKFIKINPYHLSANYVKSERLFQLKRFPEANQVITSLLKIYPDYKKAQRLARAIRMKLY